MDEESRKAFIKGYQEFRNNQRSNYKNYVKKPNLVKCLPRDSRKGI